MKKTVFIGIFTALLVYGLVFSACPEPEPELELEKKLLTLTGTITITAENGLTTGTELTAVYTGKEAVSYQWKKDKAVIDNVTGRKYIPTEPGSYTVTVSASGYKSKTSAAVKVTGDSLPDLPGSVTISPSDDITTGMELTATYSGTETVTYLWNKGGSVIAGAAGHKYTPTEPGSYTVTASATGYKSKTSAAVEVTGDSLPDLQGSVTVSPSDGVTAGTELTAAYSGSEMVTYQWNKDGAAVQDATGNKYTPSEEGSYTVTVRAPGYNSKTSAAIEVTDASLPALTGTVTIETIGIGQTLRAYTYLNGNGTISYQWNRNGTPISGANSNTYTVQSADAGSSITVTVTCPGYSGSVTSDPITVPTALTGTVSIIGTGLVRETLTADTSNLGGDGTISYRWIRKTNYNDEYGQSIGMNNSVYVVQSGDIGSIITVTVTRSGNSGSVTSESVGPVIDQNLPALTGTVSITGIAEIGQTLKVNTDSLGGTGTIFYYWKRGTTNIGTNNNSYFVPFADAGSTITVIVYRSGNSGSITSNSVVITSGEATLSTPGLAFTLNNNGTAYSVSKGTATANEVVIPSFYNELPITEIPEQGFSGYTNMTSIRIPSSVTSISQSAFYGCSSLMSITIPFVGASLNRSSHFGYIFGASTPSNQNSYIPPSLKTVVITSGTSIGSNAFSGCSDLTSITIPSSVTSIGYQAFSGCSGLISITIPSSVTSIGQSAFSGCSSLTSIAIPSSVESIGSNAFSGCSGLTSITIPFVGEGLNGSSNTHFGYIFGASSSLNQNSSIPSSLKTVVITGGTSIGSSAFSGCSGLTSITIPSSVTSIGQSAFSGCSGLTSVTIPSSVTSIGQSAFSGCSGLTSITIPLNGNSSIYFGYIFGASNSSNQNSYIPPSLKTVVITDVMSIRNNAFNGCSGLTNIIIPSSVTSIGQSAFSGCSGLTSITIPSSVTSIGYRAFNGCSGLTSIIIPSSVESIGDSVFSGCSDLTSITIPSSVTSIGYSSFSGCSGLASITIPSSVTSIGVGAFAGCTSLTSVTIPSSVTSIGQLAFSVCSGLTSVTFQGTITSDNLGYDAFGHSSNEGYIGDLRDKYLAGGIGTYTRSDTTSLTWTKE